MTRPRPHNRPTRPSLLFGAADVASDVLSNSRQSEFRRRGSISARPQGVTGTLPNDLGSCLVDGDFGFVQILVGAPALGCLAVVALSRVVIPTTHYEPLQRCCAHCARQFRVKDISIVEPAAERRCARIARACLCSANSMNIAISSTPGPRLTPCFLRGCYTLH